MEELIPVSNFQKNEIFSVLIVLVKQVFRTIDALLVLVYAPENENYLTRRVCFTFISIFLISSEKNEKLNLKSPVFYLH